MTSVRFALLCALGPVLPRPPATQPAPGSPAPAQLSDEEIQRRIDTYMGAIDTRIKPAEWRELGSRGAAILERMAADPNLLPTRRARAVEALSLIGSASAPDLLLSLARSETEPLIVRLAAVRRAESVVPRSRLTVALKPVLENARDGQVRRAAAEVLSEHGGCALVRAQARREDEPLRMQRALQRCGE